MFMNSYDIHEDETRNTMQTAIAVTPTADFVPHVPDVFIPNESQDFGESAFMRQSSDDNNGRPVSTTFVAETLGTFIFVWLGLMNVTQFVIYNANITWTGVAIAWSVALYVGIQIAAKKSNAYLNPCIALGDVVLGRLSIGMFLVYTGAELLGAFMAAVMTYALNYTAFPDDANAFPCGVFATGHAVSKLQAFFLELIATSMLAFVIYRTPSSSAKPAIIAGTLGTLALTFGFQTAFSYNFARDFAPRVFAGLLHDKCFDMEYGIIVALADFSGAVAGALFGVYVVSLELE